LVIELDVRESLSPSGSRRMACTQALGILYVQHVQHILPVLKREFWCQNRILRKILRQNHVGTNLIFIIF
jgi:hypothetical protein